MHVSEVAMAYSYLHNTIVAVGLVSISCHVKAPTSHILQAKTAPVATINMKVNIYRLLLVIIIKTFWGGGWKGLRRFGEGGWKDLGGEGGRVWGEREGGFGRRGREGLGGEGGRVWEEREGGFGGEGLGRGLHGKVWGTGWQVWIKGVSEGRVFWKVGGVGGGEGVAWEGGRASEQIWKGWGVGVFRAAGLGGGFGRQL